MQDSHCKIHVSNGPLSSLPLLEPHMPSPVVVALEEARSRIASAVDSDMAEAGEAFVARRLARDLDQAILRLQGQDAERDLLSVVCHDLKDPLASIVMGAGFLRKTVAREETSARRVIDAIARSAERMSQVIGDFPDLARLDAGRMVLDRQACDVSSTLRAAILSFEASAKEAGIELAPELPDAPLNAFCDRGRLQQIVSKLVGNALRFTPRGGGVVVRASREGDLVRISVSDTGRGIPAERLTTIFDYAANARRTPRDGPGLGLAIVRGLVELQGGRVMVESRVSEGSVFAFTLPARQ
jgi:signal transduction histidine kinase